MFDAAARHLNFGLAAEELNLTQGAVAQQVRKLEQDLGLKLFHRLARGLALTEVGHNYSVSIGEALKIIEQATLKLQPPSTSIKLSVPPSLASKWLVPKLRIFNQLYPEINVEIAASETLTNFKNDGVNLAIRMGLEPFAKGLNFKFLAQQKLCAVCSPEFAKNLGEITTVEDLCEYERIHDEHSRWQEFIPALPPLEIGLRFNQTALAMDAAIDGQGIALIPYLLAEADIENGKLVELWRNDTSSQLGYYIVYADLNGNDQMINWLLSQVET